MPHDEFCHILPIFLFFYCTVDVPNKHSCFSLILSTAMFQALEEQNEKWSNTGAELNSVNETLVKVKALSFNKTSKSERCLTISSCFEGTLKFCSLFSNKF